jgi:hypothetical protein
LAKIFLLDFLSDALGFFRSSLHRALSYTPNLIARMAFPDDTLTMQKSKILFFELCVWVSPRDIDRWINPTLPTNFTRIPFVVSGFSRGIFVSSCALLGLFYGWHRARDVAGVKCHDHLQLGVSVSFLDMAMYVAERFSMAV